MASLRQVAGCLGLSGNISIVHDFFGHRQAPDFNSLSVLKQIKLLQGPHIHLNLILVGTDENGLFSHKKEVEISTSIEQMRLIYAQVNLGVGRIQQYGIPIDEAKGYDIIDNRDEAADLTHEWTIPNNGLDLFLVLDDWPGPKTGTLSGLSPIPGSCDKNDKDMNGVVVSLGANSPFLAGYRMAHEVAHYLGLKHTPDLTSDQLGDWNNYPPEQQNNLMFPVPFAIPPTKSPQLNGGQVIIMKAHCFVQAGC
jgi:hypothetical protein